jgi:hypothetical protein
VLDVTSQRSHGRYQAEVPQAGRVQTTGDLLEVGRYGPHSLGEQGYIGTTRTHRLRQPTLECIQLEGDNGQLLADTVVELARDSGPLCFLHLEESTPEASQILFRNPPGAMGPGHGPDPDQQGREHHGDERNMG